MIATLPKAVTEAWGDQVADEFASWLEGVLSDTTVSSSDWELTQVRLGVIEHDVADLKADLRLFRQEVTARFERLSAEMNQRFDTMHREMVAQTRWAIGLLALFIAVSVLF